jgi:sialate O-acetylesterase
MVLQQQKPVRVWGWAAPGKTVTVTLGESQATVDASPDGQWHLTLPPRKAGSTPLIMTIQGADDTIIFKDILVGEVWLASGQSNMAFGLSGVPHANEVIQKADHPTLRIFTVPRAIADQPTLNVTGHWEKCTPDTAPTFSAVGYYFARRLQKELDIPVGLINAAWGGSHINGFIPYDGYQAEPALNGEFGFLKDSLMHNQKGRDDYLTKMTEWVSRAKSARQTGEVIPDPPEVLWPGKALTSRHLPTALYNGMIHPFSPAAIRGVIWYQGEMNYIDGLFYYTRMRALIRGLRAVWHQKALPFYYVQLAPHPYGKGHWQLPLIWAAQTRIMQTVPNTGMAVILDTVNNVSNIHPPDKKPVGDRLARWALAKTYRRKNVVVSGPVYESMSIENDAIRIRFRHAETGLGSRDGKSLTWFTIAGKDNFFQPAEAIIDGKTILVRSDQVAEPVAVRFAWSDIATPNLVNGEGLPAVPFRTDAAAPRAFQTWRGPNHPSQPTD